MSRFITIFTLLVIVFTKVYSQSTDLEHKNSIKKIFLSKSVSDVVEDLEGYVWIATDEGVYRYNGTKYIHFTIKDGLPTNDIIYLNVDSKNRIWLTGFYTGLYYIENKIVKKVSNSERSIDLAFGFEKKDTVYFHDKVVNNSYYYAKDKLYTYKNKLFPKNQILGYDSKNNLKIEYNWYKTFINNKHIQLGSDEKGTFLYYPNLKYDTPTFIKLKGTSNFPFISRAIPNNYKAFENEKLVSYKIDNTLSEADTLYNFGKFESKNHFIFLTSKNKIIVNTKGAYNKLLSDKLNKLQFNFSDFYFVYIDSKNNFWFIDKNKSLSFVSSSYDDTKTIFRTQMFQNSQEHIIDFIKYNEYYIMATNKNKIYSFNNDSKQIKLIKDYKNEIIRSLKIKNDTLIVDQQNYLNRYRISEKSIKEISKSEKSYKKIMFYNNETFYASTNKIYDSRYKEIWEVHNKKNITSIILDSSYFYFTTYDNIIRLSKKAKESTSVNIKNGSSIGILDNCIVAGTNEGQIMLFNKNLKLIDKLALDEKIIDLKFDIFSKWIYVQTKKKIIFLSKNKNNKLQFEYQINNLGNDAKIVAYRYDADFIYYSTENTIRSLRKKQLIKPLKASLDIDKGVTMVTNKKVETNSFLLREENSLSFDVSLKTNDNLNDFIVYYDLIHNNKTIIKQLILKSENLTFHNLNPGNYTIYFKVVPKYGNSKPTFNSINFYIEYHFWETIWFKIISFIVLILSPLSISILIRKRILKKQKMIDSLITLEQKALTAQMNPHFIFNALNNIQSSMLLEGERAANKHFVNFSRLLRTTLDILNTDKITIDDEITYLKSYVNIEQLNSKEGIDINFIIDDAIQTTKDMIPVMLLQPLVENSILHGFKLERKNKKIDVKFVKNDNNTITVFIEDNGNGIKDDANTVKKHKSYATSILKKRLEILSKLEKAKYSISITNINSSNDSNKIGTKVILVIPIKELF